MSSMRVGWATVAVILLVIVTEVHASATEYWLLSLKHVPLGEGERIVRFSIKLRSAAIVSLPTLPRIWGIHLKNFLNEEPDWNTSVEGVAGVGSAALDLAFFTDFLVLEMYQSKYAPEFDIEVVLSTTADFETARERKLAKRDVLLTPLPSRKGLGGPSR